MREKIGCPPSPQASRDSQATSPDLPGLAVVNYHGDAKRGAVLAAAVPGTRYGLDPPPEEPHAAGTDQPSRRSVSFGGDGGLHCTAPHSSSRCDTFPRTTSPAARAIAQISTCDSAPIGSLRRWRDKVPDGYCRRHRPVSPSVSFPSRQNPRIPDVRSAISNFDQVLYPEKLSAPSRPLDLRRGSVQCSAAVSNKNGLGFQPMSWEQAWDGPSIRE